MGMGVFSNPDGCGRGEGIVHLRITYTPFTMFQRHPADSITVRSSTWHAALAGERFSVSLCLPGSLKGSKLLL